MLNCQLLKASDIKKHLKRGTMHFLMLAVQQSSFLCDIVATASRIREKTQNYMLLYKLRKHLAEQSQCKNKDLCKVMDPESKLKSLDTDLL